MHSVLAIVLCLGIVGAYGATRELSIEESTRACEAEVPAYCVSDTCPQYCAALRSKNQRTRCSSECTKEKRCKLKPAVAGDSPNNMALDAQNRDQLFACIAEKRDPNNTKTGRRTTPWKQLRTPSFVKAVRP